MKTLFLVAFILLILPFAGRTQDLSPATRIQVKKMEISNSPPLAQQAGKSGEVTLHLTVSKSGEVRSVDVVSMQPSGSGWVLHGGQSKPRSNLSFFVPHVRAKLLSTL